MISYLLCNLFVSLDYSECEACFYKSLEFQDQQEGKSLRSFFTYVLFALVTTFPPCMLVGYIVDVDLASSIMR